MTATDFFSIDRQQGILFCTGEWSLKKLMSLQTSASELSLPPEIKVINGSKIQQMDSAGALILRQLLDNFSQPLALTAFKEVHSTLLHLVNIPNKKWQEIPRKSKPNRFARLGMFTINNIKEFTEFLSFVGEVFVVGLRILLSPKRIPWRAALSVIESTGVYALPIIGLLSFLIGVVLTYQMGLQLKNYGANIYIFDLLGLAIPREFAPLITAIIVAGRSGSAFTAQIGTMKIREEVDALRTMGITPAEMLILPKIFGLFIVVPLLTVWATIFAIAGGIVVSKSMLDVGYTDFIQRFYEAVSVNSYYTGLIKAPVFGVITAAIGCYQGMKVTGSAVSIGQKTTVSVVQAIFFIIVADAIFSIIFSWLGI